MVKFEKRAGFAGVMMALLSIAAGCDVNDGPGHPQEKPPQAAPVSLEIDVTQAGHVKSLAKEDDGSYTIVLPDNADPYIYLLPLESEIDAANTVLAFEYTADDPIDRIETFFWNKANKYDAAYATFIAGAGAASEWTPYSARLKNEIEKFYWGVEGDYLRLDLGETNRNGSVLRIRNIVLRPMNDEEQAAQDADDALVADKNRYAKAIEDYLDSSYPCSVSSVSVEQDRITISGTFTGEGRFFLAEFPPFEDIFSMKKADAQYRTDLDASPFTVTIDRYVTYGGVQYDRLLSKWAVCREGEEKDELVSHATYPAPENVAMKGTQLERIALKSKKGLGGMVMNGDMLVSEISELQLSSGTVNILPTIFMGLTPAGTRTTPYEYLGKTYYIDEAYLKANIDPVLETAAANNISVAGILLIQKASESADPEFGALLQHPDFQNGVYTMPDMTTPDAVNAYAAAVSFLCERYSEQSRRISHWIVHNEVDGGVHWTNMGPDVPVATFMDTYLKSMRTVYNIMCQYDRNAQAFVSLAHGWKKAAGGGWYSVVDVLDFMNRFSGAEGDFYWVPAYHSYSGEMGKPRVWEDANVSFSMNTNYVSMRNLEVLDKWVHTDANKYKGTQLRKVWLSEAGIGSGSTTEYNEKNLADHAAGTAYSWLKINALEGIEGIQWHNWFDSKEEGAQLGLRKYNDDVHHGEAKPAWYAYKAAGSDNESTYFAEQGFADTVGPEEWNVIHPVTE